MEVDLCFYYSIKKQSYFYQKQSCFNQNTVYTFNPQKVTSIKKIVFDCKNKFETKKAFENYFS